MVVTRRLQRCSRVISPAAFACGRLAPDQCDRRVGTAVQDFAADAAKNHLADPRVAIPAYNQQIALMIRHAREQFGAYANTACLANFSADLDDMTPQRGHQGGVRSFRRAALGFVSNVSDDANGRRIPYQIEGVEYRARGLIEVAEYSRPDGACPPRLTFDPERASGQRRRSLKTAG